MADGLSRTMFKQLDCTEDQAITEANKKLREQGPSWKKDGFEEFLLAYLRRRCYLSLGLLMMRLDTGKGFVTCLGFVEWLTGRHRRIMWTDTCLDVSSVHEPCYEISPPSPYDRCKAFYLA